jgi:hypothetical protein
MVFSQMGEHMKTKMIYGILTMVLTLGLATDTLAKGGAKAAKTDRIRLAAEVESGDLELPQVMQAKFESRDVRRRLHVEAQGFAIGDIFTVSININGVTHLLGDMEVDDTLEAEIDFRQDSWLLGLPTSIPAGSTVIVKKGAMITNLVLQSK